MILSHILSAGWSTLLSDPVYNRGALADYRVMSMVNIA